MLDNSDFFSFSWAQTQTPRNYDSSGAPQTSGQRSGGGWRR